jgi:1,4-dihydroxy-2-naphthoate octaprenyltransferase
VASAREWIEGARLRTLPASSSPVVAGSGLAWFVDAFSWWKALLCLVVALAIQLGCNFANDYSDGIRGSDNAAHRVGPLRLVGSGKAEPRHVKWAAFGWFAVACAAGLALAITSSHLWLVAVGAASVAAAWFYTGGKHPYGYAGWGEVMVFLFFGFIAFFGTAYVQGVWPVPEAVAEAGVTLPGVPPSLTGAAIAGATAMGCLATAILVTNNLRDIAGDAQVGKRTLATRMGDRATRWFDMGLVVAAAVAVVVAAALTTWWALAGLIGLALLVKPSLRVMANAKGLELISVLKLTGASEFAVAAGLTLGWVIGR